MTQHDFKFRKLQRQSSKSYNELILMKLSLRHLYATFITYNFVFVCNIFFASNIFKPGTKKHAQELLSQTNSCRFASILYYISGYSAVL